MCVCVLIPLIFNRLTCEIAKLGRERRKNKLKIKARNRNNNQKQKYQSNKSRRQKRKSVVEILSSSDEIPTIYTDSDYEFSEDFSETKWFFEICGNSLANSQPKEKWDQCT